MTSEDIVQIFSPRRVLLKRSVSATDVNISSFAALNLRDTKSFSGNMDDIKSAPQKFMEKVGSELYYPSKHQSNQTADTFAWQNNSHSHYKDSIEKLFKMCSNSDKLIANNKFKD